MAGTVEKRTFFFGPKERMAEVRNIAGTRLGHVVCVDIPPVLAEWRAITDINISSMPSAFDLPHTKEEPVRWAAYRDGEAILNFMLNFRGTYRWVGLDDAPIISGEQILSITVEPCHRHTNIFVVSDIERDPARKERRKFSECFRYEDGVTLWDVTAHRPEDVPFLTMPRGGIEVPRTVGIDLTYVADLVRRLRGPHDAPRLDLMEEAAVSLEKILGGGQ